MITLFISDLHLQPHRPIITERFLELLEAIPGNVETLYILGDLFEAWIGDDDPNPFHRNIIQKLHQTSHAGVKIIFMHGNRDFLIGESFANEANVTLLKTPTVIELYSQSVLLMHGDTLCTDDKKFMAYLKRVYNETFQQDILKKPLWFRRGLAYLLRMKSHYHQRFMKDPEIMDVNEDTVISIMKKHQTTILIHGHTHRLNIHAVALEDSTATRYVLGDWGETGNFLLWEPNRPPRFCIFSNKHDINQSLFAP